MFFGHTRYSLYSPESGAWVASRGGKFEMKDEYRDYLFSDERLNIRAHIFAEYTVPMLAIAAEGYDVTHYVSYSDLLPQHHQDVLQSLASKYMFLKLDRVPVGASPIDVYRAASMRIPLYRSKTSVKSSSPFGVYRLDDDDVLSADYFRQMSPYLQDAHVGYVVSLGRGVEVLYEDGGFSNPRDAHDPMHSKGHLGVCQVENGEVRAPVGAPHNRADRFNPTILDSRRFSHLSVRHLTQDTSLHHSHRDLEGRRWKVLQSMEAQPPLGDDVDLSLIFPAITGAFQANV